RFEISQSGPARDGTAPGGLRVRVRHQMGTRWNASLPGLRGGGEQSCRGVNGGVVEVDFFDEASCQLIVGEIDLIAGVQTRAAVLAHPPEGHGAKDGDGRVGGGAGGEGLENVGPNYGVAVQDGGAVG